ncbi:Lysosomal acid phosphatase [Paragonimus heterotremus]|uniref:acid phosphatase n=1 Tax=Paragonimus heterotremus TaxID=100268 RepID=A0A8J4WLP1_9TREM|nr:Lysosomal acid phosphatase [Paragonimus heterotremus]
MFSSAFLSILKIVVCCACFVSCFAEYVESIDNNTSNVLKLQHIHVLFRHGDRTPLVDPINKDVPFVTTWPLGPGQLTEKGILQEYELGRWLRKKYEDFIPEKYNGSDFHMRSTDVDRTLMSAQCVSAGVFHNSSSPLQPYGINWRPIPVHTVSQEADVLLSVAPCPFLDLLRGLEMKSEAAIETEKNHSALFELINRNLGVKIDRYNLWEVSDTLTCMEAHDMQFPDWCSEQVYKELIEVETFYWNLMFTSRTEILRLEIGVFLSAFVDHVTSVVDNTYSPIIKGPLSVQHLLAYSAHDTDVSYLLAALGVFDDHLVEYSAAVVLELLGPDPPAPSSYYRLRVLYKRGYPDDTGEYRVLPPCHGRSGEDGCPLDRVLRYLEPFLLKPDEHNIVCAVTQDSKDKRANPIPSYLVYSLLGVSLALCLIVGVSGSMFYRWRRCRSDMRFEQLLTSA